MLYTFTEFFFAKTHTCMHTYIQIHKCIHKNVLFYHLKINAENIFPKHI